ncbi:MAG: hypothetical protein ABSE82_12455 [Nitrososphaerales archaeon]
MWTRVSVQVIKLNQLGEAQACVGTVIGLKGATSACAKLSGNPETL